MSLDFSQETDKGVKVGTEIGVIGSTRGTAGNLVAVRVGTPGGNPIACTVKNR